MKAHVTFDTAQLLSSKRKKEHMTDSLQRIQNMVKIVTPENFRFNFQRSFEFSKILSEALLENNLLNIKVDEKIFKDVYLELSTLIINKHTIIRQFKGLIGSNDFEQLAENIMWLVVYDLILDRALNKHLSVTKNLLYNVLSMRFTIMRRQLAMSSSSAYVRFIELYSALIAATALILMLHSHLETELYCNVNMVWKIEMSVRQMLIGFSSPDINSFHTIVHELMPDDLKMAIPKKLKIGGDGYNTDLTTTISYEPQMAKEWNSRNNCLFQATSRTGLLANALKLRGMSAHMPTKGHRVVRGTIEKSQLPITKAKNIVASVNGIVNDHEEVTRHLLNDMRMHEKEFLSSPNLLTTPKPLPITFENFHPDMSSPGVFQVLMRSPRRYNINNIPPPQKKPINVDELNHELEYYHEELRKEVEESLPKKRFI